MNKVIINVFLLFFSLTYFSFSRPQYSILQTYGTKCSNCHVNVQGGGVRSGGGWLSRKDLSLIPTDAIGIDGFYNELSTNTVFDDVVLFGMDARLQSARWPSGQGTKRDFMFMQASPYLVITPLEWLWFEGFYNIAYEIYTDKRYIGQNPFAFSLYIKPYEDLPSLRVGFFQPTIGQKWDDHTMLIRQVVANKYRAPLIPTDYAEWGAQLDYENLSWLSLSAGVFTSKNMASLITGGRDGKSRIPIVDTNSMGIALRGFVTPEIPLGLTGYAGGTLYLNDDYRISSVFLGIGKSDLISLVGEFIYSEKDKDLRKTYGFLTEITYQLTESVLPFIRAERMYSREKFETRTYYTTQFVFGAHINLLPYLDILPEYRIFDREHYEGQMKQWTVQAHLFY